MHEFSLAKSLSLLAQQRCPKGLRVRVVHVQAGPLRGIDRNSMTWAWEVARGGCCAAAELQLELLPWRLRCPDCGDCWETDTLDSVCVCGSYAGLPIGGEELMLTELEVDQAEDELPGPSPGRSGGGSGAIPGAQDFNKN